MGRIEPVGVAEAVERYVRSELHDAQQFSNRKPLDESGIWSLHALAPEVYAMGWQDGEAAEERRSRGLTERATTPPAVATEDNGGSR